MAALNCETVFSSRRDLGRSFHSLAAAYWKEDCPMSDFVFGRCSSVTSLRDLLRRASQGSLLTDADS